MKQLFEAINGNRKFLNEFPLPNSSLLFDLSTLLSPNYKKRNNKKQ